MPVKNILVVDDSPTERFFTVDLLTKAGYQVTTAENGDERIAKAKASKPDLILMDVVMPGMNGFQATRAINRQDSTKHIPIIMCTSKNQATDIVWAKRQGATEYVVKPVDPQELLSKIASL